MRILKSERAICMKLGWILLVFALAISGGLQAATIHETIDTGDSAATAAMLDADPKLLTELLPNGRTPLHTAAYGGKLNIVQLLIARGADVNSATPTGSTPLHGAALYGHEAVVRLLVEKGAKVDVANRAGYTPLTNSAGSANLSLMKFLIDAGGKINPPSDSVIPPISSAINRSWMEGIEYLLGQGAKANATVSDHGDLVMATVLNAMWKVDGSERAPEILQLLFKHGADPNYAPPSGFTAVMSAARANDTALLNVLLDAGCNPNAVSLVGATAFGSAVSANCLEAAQFLVRKNAYKLAVNNESGRTTLHDAVTLGTVPMAELVLAVTPDPNQPDSLGFTPLDLALRYGHRQIADLLKAKGAVPKAPAREHLSTEHLAQQPGEGEAYLWYLGNCGYLIKTHNHCLIFDYWNANASPTEPSLANGHINTAELASENLTVFVTHEHSDHFDSTIFGWADKIPGLQYVFGFRPESLDARYAQATGVSYGGQPYEYVGPGMLKTIDGMKIFAIEANDAGVGFVVSVDGLTIYHAGDHAGWLPDQRPQFIAQIDAIDAAYDSVDIALVNVTGCHHQDTIALAEGTAYTISKLDPKLVIPTHASGREQFYRKFMNKFTGQFPTLQSFCPMGRGDAVKFNGGKKSEQVELL